MKRSKSDNHWRRLKGPTDLIYVREGALSVDYVRQGSTFRVAVVLEIKHELGNRYEWITPYHINSSQPYDPQLIPTRLELEEVKGFTLSPVQYPKGRDVALKFSSQPLSVYSAIPGKPIVLMFSVHAASDIPLDMYYLKGKLNYQPCSDKGCETIKSVEIRIPVTVVDEKTPVRRVNKYYFGLSMRDYLLIPVRAVTLTGKCVVKGCS